MRVLTETEYAKATAGKPYWDGRWSAYLGKVCEILGGIPAQAESTLEIGANGLPLVPGSWAMDRPDNVPDARGRSVPWELGRWGRWPFPANTFSLVVALQVWEHIRVGRRAMEFREAVRVGGTVVLSIPYEWRTGPSDHLGLSGVDVLQWSGGREWDRVEVIGSPGRRRGVFLWFPEVGQTA